MPTWAEVVFLACAVGFILALKGLSGPRTARVGNLVGAAAAVVACAVPFFYADLDNVIWILVAIAVGTAVGAVGAQRVQMTQMPELVAFFHSMIGMAAVFIAIAAAVEPYAFGIVARPAAGGAVDPIPTGNRLELILGAVRAAREV